MTAIIITKTELFERVSQETIYLSDPIGAKEANAENRLADILPITKDDMPYFETKLYEVGVEVLKKIAPYTSGIDFPYRITDATETTYPNSIIFQFNLPSELMMGVIITLLQQAITETLILYIIKEWLKTKNYPYQEKELQYEKSLSKIKQSFMFGKRAKTTYRTL